MKTIEFATKKALNGKTPLWANNMFRITFIVTSAITVFFAGTQIIDENIKYELMLGLKTLDALVLGFSKMFGVIEEK